MSYDIDAIRKKVAELSGDGKTKTDDVKFQYWKPEMGANEIRFLPYDDGQGQPFQEVGFYNSKKLSQYRITAPCQYGKPDPIQDLLNDLRKTHQDDATWELMKQLQMRSSYYAPIIVRGKEDKGWFLWEMSQKLVKGIYSKLAHKNFSNLDLFDIEEGFDFTITATDSGKTFNGYMVKDYEIEVARDPSVALQKKSERDALLKSVPDLGANFEKYVKNEEKMKELVLNFLGDNSPTEEGTKVIDSKPSVEEKTEEVTAKIDDAFADL